MLLLGPLAALLGIELDAFIGKLKRSAIAYAAVAVCGLVCVIFLLIAVHIGLSILVGPLWAALIIAVSAAAIGAATALWLQAAERARQRREEERRRAAQATALASTAAAGALPLMRKSPWLAAALVPAGAAAGYLWYRYRNKGKRR